MFRNFGVRIFSMLTHAVALWSLASMAALGQGTIQFGFEDLPVDSTPPFVSLVNWEFPSRARVADSASAAGTPISVFEGEKFLLAWGNVLLASPDGKPIQS